MAFTIKRAMKEFLGITITEELYHSEQTSIYAGTRDIDGLHVIIKKKPNNPRSYAALYHEFEVLSATYEPHHGIVRPLGFIHDDQQVSLLVERAAGIPLGSYHGLGLSLQSRLRVMRSICQALEAVHVKHFMHLDLSLDNIIVDPATDRIQLIDFETASDLDHESLNSDFHGLTKKGATLPFLSPEQTGRTHRFVDYRSDYYALGVIFFHILTGKLPFNASDPIGWMHCHLSLAPPRVSKLNPKIPELLSGVVAKLLEKQAENRYQSLQGLIFDLEWISSHAEVGDTDFQLASRDFSPRLNIPEKLYGRQAQIEKLHQDFQTVAEGASATIMIHGESGVGKTALIRSLLQALTTRRGLYASGKFDQYQKDIPYVALQSIIDQLIDRLLLDSEDALSDHRRALKMRLGRAAQALSTVSPALKSLLGFESVMPLDNDAASQLLTSGFPLLIGYFARQDQPLILFIDDLQWADSASLKLLKSLFEYEISYLLLLGSYRSSSISKVHPFQKMLAELEQPKYQTIELLPLRLPDLAELLRDTIKGADVTQLAAVLYQKTQRGNPFFVHELLNKLAQQQVFIFDKASGHWSWKIDDILNASSSDDVVDLMLESLHLLPLATQQVLQRAACLGNSFAARILSAIVPGEARLTIESLLPAIKRGIVIALNDNYKMLLMKESKFDDLDSVKFKFQHDKVQQAAYLLFDQEGLAAIHLDIGRSLHSAGAAFLKGSDSLIIAGQFNQAKPLIVERGEQLLAADLNYSAAQLAKKSGSFDTAFQFLEQGIGHLPEEAWSIAYDIVYRLYLEYVQTAGLSGKFGEIDGAIAALLSHVTDYRQKIDLLGILCWEYFSNGKNDLSIQTSLDAFTHLGLSYSLELPAGLVAERYHKISKSIPDDQILALDQLPAMTDPMSLATMRMLQKVGLVMYYSGHTDLYGLAVMEMVDLAHEKGISSASATSFSSFAIINVLHFAAFKRANLYAKVALSLAERYSDDAASCARIYHACGCVAYFWTEPFETVRPLIQKSIDISVEHGLQYPLSNASATIVSYTAATTISQSLRDQREIYSALTEHSKDRNHILFGKIWEKFWLCLLAQEDLEQFAQTKEFISHFETSRFTYGVACQLTTHAQLFFFHQLYPEAVSHFQKVQPFTTFILGTMLGFEYVLFYGLSISSYLLSGPAELGAHDSRRFKAELEVLVRQMELWAESCAINFRPYFLLLCAEQALLRGHHGTALGHYNDALAALSLSIRTKYSPVVYERAALGYIAAQQEMAGALLMKRALSEYQHCNVEVKSRSIQLDHGVLLEKLHFKDILPLRSGRPERPKAGASGTRGRLGSIKPSALETSSEIDFLSLIKACQSLSSEVNIDQLLIKLMEYLLENAGADYACLFLLDERSQSLQLEAYKSEETERVVRCKQPLDTCATLCPIELINYVKNKGQSQVIGDATLDTHLVPSNYLSRKKVKSVLCMPVVRSGKISGILYLENSMSVDVFTEERLDLLAVLVAQAGVSVENAQLYRSLEERVSEKTSRIRSVLKSIKQGILVILPEGKIDSEFSSHLHSILETDDIAGRSISEVLIKNWDLGDDGRAALEQAIAFSMGEDLISFACNEHLLPREVSFISKTGKSKILELDWDPIANDKDCLDRILLAIRDVTEQRAIQVQIAEQQAELTILSQLLVKSAKSIHQFFGAYRQAMEEISHCRLLENCDGWLLTKILRHFHTIKGHARTLGFNYIADDLHRAESQVKEFEARGELPDAKELEPLLLQVQRGLDRYEDLYRSKISVHQKPEASPINSEYFEILSAYLDPELLKFCREALDVASLPIILQDIVGSLPDIAKSLAKTPPRVAWTGQTVWFTKEAQPLLQTTFMHLMRNSLDHGIEADAMRSRQGKPSGGVITLASRVEDEQVVIELFDDGGGLNLSAVARKCQVLAAWESGQMEASDIAQLVFTSGISTKDELTEISGRGIGLDAVKSLLLAAGGDITIILGDVLASGSYMFKTKIVLPRSLTLKSKQAPNPLLAINLLEQAKEKRA